MSEGGNHHSGRKGPVQRRHARHRFPITGWLSHSDTTTDDNLDLRLRQLALLVIRKLGWRHVSLDLASVLRSAMRPSMPIDTAALSTLVPVLLLPASPLIESVENSSCHAVTPPTTRSHPSPHQWVAISSSSYRSPPVLLCCSWWVERWEERPRPLRLRLRLWVRAERERPSRESPRCSSLRMLSPFSSPRLPHTATRCCTVVSTTS